MIHRDGPLPFSRFMEAALYDPEQGYYSVPGRNPGRTGDFFTSVSVGGLYGGLLADCFASMWEALGRPERWMIAEQGAHDGRLAADVLAGLGTWHPDAFAALEWRFIETRERWRECQRATLAAAGLRDARVSWHGEGAGGPPLPGVFFSNELVDAFPVDVVVWRSGAWVERRVGAGSGPGLWHWVEVPAHSGLAAAADAAGIPRLEGHAAEIRPAVAAWVAGWAAAIPRGFAVTVDYGDCASALHAPERADGTLRAYQAHRRIESLLEEPGSRDLTADVDFSELVRAGAAQGWRPAGWLDQHRFLVGIAARRWLPELEQRLARDPRDVEAARALRQFRTLTHPEIMGRVFRVLVQERGVGAAAAAVAGLQHARPFPGPADGG